jgi:hypothetical protein
LQSCTQHDFLGEHVTWALGTNMAAGFGDAFMAEPVAEVAKPFGLTRLEASAVTNRLCIGKNTIYRVCDTTWYSFMLEAVKDAIHHATLGRGRGLFVICGIRGRWLTRFESNESISVQQFTMWYPGPVVTFVVSLPFDEIFQVGAINIPPTPYDSLHHKLILNLSGPQLSLVTRFI